MKGDKSSPNDVLTHLKTAIGRREYTSFDEAWLVVDKDEWSEVQLEALYNWTLKDRKFHLALSNPSFEFWLLLHFEDGNKVTTQLKCLDQLKKHIPKYTKSADMSCMSIERIRDAVRRAKKLDTPPCNDWPRKRGSTVYRLVEGII
jgi:hypothetical protein